MRCWCISSVHMPSQSLSSNVAATSCVGLQTVCLQILVLGRTWHRVVGTDTPGSLLCLDLKLTLLVSCRHKFNSLHVKSAGAHTAHWKSAAFLG